MKKESYKVNSIGVEKAEMGFGETEHSDGVPQSSQNHGNKDSSKEDEKKRRLNNWLEGLFYGSLPVFASFFADIVSAVSIKASLYNMLLNVSVMYIGITLLITAMNDLEPEDVDTRKCYVRVIVLGAIFYAIIQFAEKTNYNASVVMVVNVSFLGCALLLGLSQYKQVKGNKK